MRKPDFEKCTAEATNLLYKQDISHRILNVQNLDYDKNIIFDSVQNYCMYTRTPLSIFLSENKRILKVGCTIYDSKSNYYIVLYNSNVRCFEHLNWTLAHEIGHIYLGHTDDGDTEEVEAHFFASQLFMPEYTLLMMAQSYGFVDVHALTEIFGVSFEAASKRINTMKKKTFFSATREDKEIWETQRERVDLYFECLKDGSNYQNALSFWLEMKADYEREYRLEAYAQMR